MQQAFTTTYKCKCFNLDYLLYIKYSTYMNVYEANCITECHLPTANYALVLWSVSVGRI